MIVSAMFYGTDDNVESPFTLRLGPIVITVQELFVSAVSLAIVLPPSLLIVQIFRNVNARNEQIKKKQLLNDEKNTENRPPSPPTISEENEPQKLQPAISLTKLLHYAKKLTPRKNEVLPADKLQTKWSLDELLVWSPAKPEEDLKAGWKLVDKLPQRSRPKSPEDKLKMKYNLKDLLEIVPSGNQIKTKYNLNDLLGIKTVDSHYKDNSNVDVNSEDIDIAERVKNRDEMTDKGLIGDENLAENNRITGEETKIEEETEVDESESGSETEVSDSSDASDSDEWDSESDYNSLWSESDCDSDDDSKQATRKKGLPRGCLWVAWILAVLSIITPAFFVILYSMSWGPEISNAWLVSYVLSFAETIFISDPIKVRTMHFKHQWISNYIHYELWDEIIYPPLL